MSGLDRLVVHLKGYFPSPIQRSDPFDVDRKYLVVYTWAGEVHLSLTSVTQGRSLDGSSGAQFRVKKLFTRSKEDGDHKNSFVQCIVL